MDDSSTADAPNAPNAPTETLYGTLRQLANTVTKPATPVRRASSAGPSSVYRTPAFQRLGGSARRTNVLTPHGRAAMREVEARRAGLTPAKDRRRSGRQQRETPRDVLRMLSRTLAPQTQPVVPTPPQAPGTTPRRVAFIAPEDLDDEPMPKRPRMSLPLDEDDDDDDESPMVPRSAGLEDEDFTIQSVEMPRRALSENAAGRFPRQSFGSIRLSEGFGDLNNLGPDGAIDSSFNDGGSFQDGDIPDMSDMSGIPQGDNTGTLRLNLRDERSPLASGRNDFQRPSLGGDERDFVFTIPQQEEEEMPQFNDDEASVRFNLTENDDLKFPEGSEDREEELEEQDVEDMELQVPSSPQNHDVSNADGDTTNLSPIAENVGEVKLIKKKTVKISKHGIQYPSLPLAVVKKLATKFARTGGNKSKISKDTFDAILQASDWFFEQVSDDLAAYSKHAGRKTIDESDILTLMKRQRQTSEKVTPFSLAQRHLPRELLQDLRMVPPDKKKRQKKARVEEENEAQEI